MMALFVGEELRVELGMAVRKVTGSSLVGPGCLPFDE
jgi:hypothetical protein